MTILEEPPEDEGNDQEAAVGAELPPEALEELEQAEPDIPESGVLMPEVIEDEPDPDAA